MEIQAPARFVNAGNLDPKSASKDPRRANFSPNVDIDLRDCEFIQPAAVLWARYMVFLQQGKQLVVFLSQRTSVSQLSQIGGVV